MERNEVIVQLQEGVDFYSLPVEEREYDDSESTLKEWIEVLQSAIDLLVVDAHEEKKTEALEDDRGKNVYDFNFYNEEDDAHA